MFILAAFFAIYAVVNCKAFHFIGWFEIGFPFMYSDQTQNFVYQFFYFFLFHILLIFQVNNYGDASLHQSEDFLMMNIRNLLLFRHQNRFKISSVTLSFVLIRNKSCQFLFSIPDFNVRTIINTNKYLLTPHRFVIF